MNNFFRVEKDGNEKNGPLRPSPSAMLFSYVCFRVFRPFSKFLSCLIFCSEREQALWEEQGNVVLQNVEIEIKRKIGCEKWKDSLEELKYTEWRRAFLLNSP